MCSDSVTIDDEAFIKTNFDSCAMSINGNPKDVT